MYRDKRRFINSHHTGRHSKSLHGNCTKEDVLGFGSYKLELRSGYTLILHDLLYVLGIQHNLLSVASMFRT